MGIVTSYFSDTFISSYTFGSSIHVVKSQIKDLIGIQNTPQIDGYFNIPRSLIMLLSKLFQDSNWQTILLSAFCITYLVLFKELINPWIKKKIKFDFPSELLLVNKFKSLLESFLNIQKNKN